MSLVRRAQAGALSSINNADNTPAPTYVLRGHASQINTLTFNSDNAYLLSGDADGFVACWSLTTFRPILLFKAHAAGVLTALFWENKLLTHGRDNKIHIFDFNAVEWRTRWRSALPSPDTADKLLSEHTIEVNALGYCKCSLLPVKEGQALVAVPATLDDNQIDIFHLPSRKRVHKSMGAECFDDKTGTVMAIDLYRDMTLNSLKCLVGYEDGRVALFQHSTHVTSSKDWSQVYLADDEGWSKSWEIRLHKEPVMGMALQSDMKRAWTVSADHFVIRYNVEDAQKLSDDERGRAFKTPYRGRAGIAVRDDAQILAISGWDGIVRIHSAKTFKPLAALEFHRDSVFAAAFAHVHKAPGSSNTAWLATAGLDERIALWVLYQPEG